MPERTAKEVRKLLQFNKIEKITLKYGKTTSFDIPMSYDEEIDVPELKIPSFKRLNNEDGSFATYLGMKRMENMNNAYWLYVFDEKNSCINKKENINRNILHVWGVV